MLSSGLTPDEVGLLFDRTGSLVRLTARRWGLDCRALRARALGLAVTHPHIAAEFVQVIEGAPPGSRPEDLLSGSGARCRWRCDDCSSEWLASVVSRTKRGSGCPSCARRRGAELARGRGARTPPLSAADPGLVAEFVVNLSRPDRDVTTTPSGSHDRVLWRCARGHDWETEARQRIKHATQCPACLSGLWTSRLEFQVAELVAASTRLTISVGARTPRSDREADDHLDLLVEELGLLIDLDPARWHSAAESRARDFRKLQRLAGRPYVRIRPTSLGRLPDGGALRGQQLLFDGCDAEPENWARAVISALLALAPPTSIEQLTQATRAAALARADQRWRGLRAGQLRRSLATEHPVVASQFVEAVGRPTLTPADLTPAGDDRVLWQCPDCGHRWEARVANRTGLGTGCPPCSYRRGASRAALPRAGGSFAHAHPELVASFIADDTNPGRTLDQLKPNSLDRCRWACPHCGQAWTTTPHNRHRNPMGGCGSCSRRRAVTTRPPRRPELGGGPANPAR